MPVPAHPTVVLRGLVLVALAGFAAIAPAAAAETELGLQGLAIAGTHVRDGDVSTRGVVPGALLELDEHVGRAGVRIETLPVPIVVPQGGSGPFGATTIGLSILNAEATVDLLPRGLLRAGVGGQIVNLTNFDGTNGVHETARESGVSYVLAGAVPLGGASSRRAIDVRVATIPNVRARLLRFPPAGTIATNADEIGAETDLAVAYRWERGRWIYRLGARGLAYSTRDARTTDLVDRNTGAGMLFQASYRFGASELR